MEHFLTPSNIMFVVGIMGTIFGIFFYFKNPQIDSEKKDALLDLRVQMEKDQTERRFSEMNARITESMTLAQNHIHTVDTKVDGLIGSVNAMNLEMTKVITKLETTINERFPKTA